jgi:hypothetical protein
VLWKRALGEGYSSILVENGVLYTMYGRPGEEVTLAAGAATGKTIWERANPVQFHNDAADRGNGPHATPLIVGGSLWDQLFAWYDPQRNPYRRKPRAL